MRPFYFVIFVVLLSFVGIGCLSVPNESSVNETSSPSNACTDPAGCGVANPTWHKEIEPIIAAKCHNCHGANPSAPFTLLTYGEVAIYGDAIVKKSSPEGDTKPPYYMPPWTVRDTDECTPVKPWKNDERLSHDDWNTLKNWVANGAPKGDVADAQILPTQKSIILEGADVQTLTAEISHTLATGSTDDEYICFPLNPQLTAQRWATGFQVNPGNSAVVHHVILFSDPTGAGTSMAGTAGKYPCFGGSNTPQSQILLAWAPGSLPMELPNGAGMPMDAGSQFIMQVHYHPTGNEEIDTSSLMVRWTDTSPQYTAQMIVAGAFADTTELTAQLTSPPFEIPAGADNHVEEITVPVPYEVAFADVRLWSVFNHMHYFGGDMLLTVEHDNLATDCLAHNAKWDFNWQRSYVYEGEFNDFLKIQEGDHLKLKCTYNNSMSNPFMEEALAGQGATSPSVVKVGENTLDEMCVAILGIMYPTPAF